MPPRFDIYRMTYDETFPAKSSQAHLPQRQSTALLNPASTQSSGGVIISTCPAIIDQSIALIEACRDLRWTQSSIKCALFSLHMPANRKRVTFPAHSDLRERCWRVNKFMENKKFIIEQFLSANDNFSICVLRSLGRLNLKISIFLISIIALRPRESRSDTEWQIWLVGGWDAEICDAIKSCKFKRVSA